MFLEALINDFGHVSFFNHRLTQIYADLFSITKAFQRQAHVAQADDAYGFVFHGFISLSKIIRSFVKIPAL